MELYALLWRVGAVQVVGTRPARHSRLPAPVDFYLRIRGSRRPPRRSQPRLSPAPAPRRAGREECSQVAG
ncbi:hypothetical protein [Mycobacterium sp.]|uniref:hypothetical protein n=1 Tax=Mycobacterium sp. TaxID=1785 RepID=UPI003F9C0A70